jgi:hypothetical protein
LRRGPPLTRELQGLLELWTRGRQGSFPLWADAQPAFESGDRRPNVFGAIARAGDGALILAEQDLGDSMMKTDALVVIAAVDGSPA